MGGEKKMELTSLGPVAQKTLQDKAFQGRQTFQETRRFLWELARFDTQTDQLTARAYKVGCVFTVLAVIALFSLFFIVSTGVAPLMVGVVASAVIFIIISIVYYIKYKNYKKIDLSNDFKTLLLPLLDEMSEDVKDNAKVVLKLDLKGLTPEKILNEGKLPPGRFKEVTKTTYRDPWCDLSVELADGNELRLRVQNFVDQVVRKWSNPRGKAKIKIKWRKTVVVSAQLLPQSKLAWEEAKARAEAGQKLKFVEKEGVRCCRLIRKFKYKSEGINKEPTENPPLPEVMGMLIQLYSMLTPVGQRS